jgi:hypothetical protein
MLATLALCEPGDRPSREPVTYLRFFYNFRSESCQLNGRDRGLMPDHVDVPLRLAVQNL